VWHSEAARSPYVTPSVGVVEDGAAGSFSDKNYLNILVEMFIILSLCALERGHKDSDLSRLCNFSCFNK